MRALVQRVQSARVEVDHQTVSQIGPGLLVLVGFYNSDTEADADSICQKVLNMPMFDNAETGSPSDQSEFIFSQVMQRNYELLLVSQFTLYGVFKGNRLDFHDAMPSHRARSFYEALFERFCQAYNTDKVKDGIFGVKRQVFLVNDGPIAVQLDSQALNNEED